MENKDSLSYWTKIAQNNPTELTAKVNPCNDFTQMDADFIMKYANENTEILDLASSTGLTINKYYRKIKHIEAVELYKEFTKFIEKTDKISIVNCDVKDYNSDKKFDLVNMFGITCYFNDEEVKSLYKKYQSYLRPNGKIIVKSQFGVEEDVIVSGFSKELQTDYFCCYRHLPKEVEILKSVGYKDIKTFDIYPPECNRWSNTHFYAIVADK